MVPPGERHRDTHTRTHTHAHTRRFALPSWRVRRPISILEHNHPTAKWLPRVQFSTRLQGTVLAARLLSDRRPCRHRPAARVLLLPRRRCIHRHCCHCQLLNRRQTLRQILPILQQIPLDEDMWMGIVLIDCRVCSAACVHPTMHTKPYEMCVKKS